jgi:pathogenesis-related protein 1
MPSLRSLLLLVGALPCLSLPGPVTAQLSPREAEDALGAHNRWRALHRAGPLTWSEELARYAQAWAETLAQRHPGLLLHSEDGGGVRPEARSLGYGGWGENLYWASPLTWSDGTTQAQRDVTPEAVVESWADEARWYEYRSGRCSPQAPHGCGHFTQVVWVETTRVGCGRAFGADSAQVWACSYDPPGNWDGEHERNVRPRGGGDR